MRGIDTRLAVDGQSALILQPHAPANRMVLFCHGHGATAEVLLAPKLRRFTASLLRAGWLIASSDAHGNAWGSEACRDAYTRLHEYVAAQHNVSGTVLVGSSMGAIPALHLVAERRIPDLLGWVGVCPVVDLARAAGRPPLADAIRREVPSVAAVDPANIPSDRLNVPLTMVAASRDTVVEPATLRAFATRTSARLVMKRGPHTGRACFDPALVLPLDATKRPHRPKAAGASGYVVDD